MPHDTENIDPLYYPVRYSVLDKDIAAQLIGKTVYEDACADTGAQPLYAFVQWAVDNGHFKSPVLPPMPDHDVFYYYRDMHKVLQDCRDDYAQNLATVLQAYKEAFPNNQKVQSFDVALPAGPSAKWLEVMEPTSIAMGKLQSGECHVMDRLSPAGVLWRAESVKGLIEALQYAGNTKENGAFSAYTIFKPETLARYFMYCHPGIYFDGLVGFQSLPQHDIMLISRAATAAFKKEPVEILTRAFQLARDNAQKPKWLEWGANLLREGKRTLKFAFHQINSGKKTAEIREEVALELRKIMECPERPHMLSHEQAKGMGLPLIFLRNKMNRRQPVTAMNNSFF